MKYGGNFYINFSHATRTKTEDYKRALLVDEVARIIDQYPEVVVQALKDSHIKISKSPSTKEIIRQTSRGLYENELFRSKIATLIVHTNPVPEKPGATNFLHQDGAAKKSGEKAGQAGQWAAGIGQALGGLFTWLGSRQQRKADEARLQADLNAKLAQRQRNWVPYAILGGIVLLTVGIIIVRRRAKT